MRCSSGWRISYERHHSQAPKAPYKRDRLLSALTEITCFVQSKYLKDPYCIPGSQSITLARSLIGYFTLTFATLEIYFIYHGVAWNGEQSIHSGKCFYCYLLVGHAFVVHCTLTECCSTVKAMLELGRQETLLQINKSSEEPVRWWYLLCKKELETKMSPVDK